jgi:hypothetical protein
MNNMNDTGMVAVPVSGQTGYARRLRGLAGTGFIATFAAMVATTLSAALAQASAGAPGSTMRTSAGTPGSASLTSTERADSRGS